MPPTGQGSAGCFPLHWQRVRACPTYGQLHVFGEYGVRRNPNADVDDRGGHVAWEVWHWPTNSVESDWFTATDAYSECVRLEFQVTVPA